MEARDVILGDFLKSANLQSVGQGLFDGYLVLARELHEEDVDDVEYEQDQGLEELHFVAHQKDCDHDQVQQDKDRFTSYDPPVDEGFRRDNQVEHTLDNERVESGLLDDCGDSNVGDTEENGVHNDKGLGSRVGHSQQRGVHGLRRKDSFLLDNVDGRVDVILCRQ